MRLSAYSMGPTIVSASLDRLLSISIIHSSLLQVHYRDEIATRKMVAIICNNIICIISHYSVFMVVLLQVIRLEGEMKSCENLRRGIFSLFVCIAYSSHLVWIEVEIRQDKLVRNICCWKITRDTRIMAKCASGRISHLPAPHAYIFPGILFFSTFFLSLLENNNHEHYGGGCGILRVFQFFVALQERGCGKNKSE